VRLEERLQCAAHDVQPVAGFAADHVGVQVEREERRGHRWLRDERPRPAEPDFLAIPGGKDDRVLGFVCGEVLRDREEGRRAGRVVVGAVEHLTAPNPDVIVVGADDDVPRKLGRPGDVSNHVHPATLRATAAGKREGRFIRTSERRDARRLEPLDDITARLLAAGRVDLASLHVVGRQRLQIEQELRAIDEGALWGFLRGEGDRGDEDSNERESFHSVIIGQTPSARNE